MFFKKLIVHYSENHTKCMNRLSRQNAELMNVVFHVQQFGHPHIVILVNTFFIFDATSLYK